MGQSAGLRTQGWVACLMHGYRACRVVTRGGEAAWTFFAADTRIMPRMVRWRMAADRPGSKAAASCGTLDRVPGHPDKGMKPAVGEVLETPGLPEPGPLVDGDCPAVERSHGEGVTLRP